MALIVPGTVRFALNQTYEGRPVVNILDYRVDTTGTFTERAEAVFRAAGNVLNQWATHILPWQSEQLTFDSITWVDLDDPDGSTGQRVTTSEESLPQPGLSSGAALPGNTAALVRKQISGGRSRRNGRLYLCGLPEVWSTAGNGNVIDGATVANLEGAFGDFLAATNVVDMQLFDYQGRPVVVHITARDSGGNPTAGTATDIDSFSVDALLATQRRRLRP